MMHATCQKFLQARFIASLESQGITMSKPRGMVLCIFHPEKTPSISIDTDRGVFHCFGCGIGGGVKDFARLLGEEWPTGKSKATTPAQCRERARAVIAARRRAAEATARAILQRRIDE
jgi:hypothetical protein